MAQITQREIARRLGVSRSTVALALNPSYAGRLSPEVREKVRKAAEKWNYRPDQIARIMRGGRSGVVGIFHFGGLMQVAAERVFHAIRALRQAGYEVSSHDVSWAPGAVAPAVASMIGARVEGVIVAGLDSPSLGRAFGPFHAAGIPVVALSGNALSFAPHLRGDARNACRELTRHLLDFGHRRLAVMAHDGRNGRSYDWAGSERIRGFREELARAGGSVRRKFSRDHSGFPEGVIVPIPPANEGFDPFARGHSGMEHLFGEKVAPSAVLCEDDEVAIGALHAIRRRGLKVPDDISVTGYDDTAAGRYCEVPLTTVRQPNQAMAEKSVEILLDRILTPAARESRSRVLFPCEVVARQSSGPVSL